MLLARIPTMAFHKVSKTWIVFIARVIVHRILGDVLPEEISGLRIVFFGHGYSLISQRWFSAIRFVGSV